MDCNRKEAKNDEHVFCIFLLTQEIIHSKGGNAMTQLVQKELQDIHAHLEMSEWLVNYALNQQ